MKKYFNSKYIHIGYLIEALQKNPGFIITSKMILANPYKNPRKWSRDGNNWFQYGLNLGRLYLSMKLFGYNKKIIYRGLKKLEHGLLFHVPFEKRNGLRINLYLLKESIYIFKSLPSFWIIDLPILLMPRIFLI